MSRSFDPARTQIASGGLVCLALAISVACIPEHVQAQSTPAALQVSAEERAAKLAERDRLAEEAGELCAAGKLGEALERLSRYIRVQRELFSDKTDGEAEALEQIAEIQGERQLWAEARAAASDALAIREKVHGHDDWRTIDARLLVADVQRGSKLTDVQRIQLAKAAEELGQAETLSDAGKDREGLTLVQKVRDMRLAILGEQHRLTADALIRESEFHYLLRDYAKAEAADRHALKILEQVVGKEHPDYATNLNSLAFDYKGLQDLAQAADLFRKAGETREHAIGEVDDDVRTYRQNLVDVLEKLAAEHQQHQRFAEARKCREEILSVSRELWGAEDWEVVDAKLALADVDVWAGLDTAQREQLAMADRLLADVSRLNGQGRYREAIPLADQSLALRRQVLGDEHRLTGNAWSWLGALYNEIHDVKNAERANRRALEIRKQILGHAHPDYATSLSNLARMYRDMGDYARAEPLYQQALEIRKNALGESDPDYARSLNYLALLYDMMGDYARAEPLYQQALQIRKQVLGESDSEYGQSLNNLAMLYKTMGDYARAEPLYRQALEIRKKALGESHPDYAQSLNNLALLYKTMGDYARAALLYEQALKIRKNVLGESHPDYAQSLNNLALLYETMGDYARAELLFKQSLEIKKKALGASHPDYAIGLNNLALLYRKLGNNARAEPLFKQALEIKKKALGEAHPDYALSLRSLGLLQLDLGQSADAEKLLRQAVQIERKSLDLTAAVQSEQQQLTMAGKVRSYLDSYLASALAAKIAPAEIYAEVAAWKGSVSAQQQLLRGRQRALAGDPDSELGQLFSQLDSQTRQLAALTRQTPKPEEAAQRQQDLHELSESVDALQQELSRLDPDFHRAWAERKVLPENLRQALPASAALVDLLIYRHYLPSTEKGKKPTWERCVVAFVLRRDEPLACVPLGACAPVELLVSAWRDGNGQRATAEGKLPGDELRRLLWEPLAAHLSGAETVLISPDGALAELPWGALPGDRPGTFLVEGRAVAVIAIPQLLSDLLTHEPHAGPPASLLLVGDIDYGGDPGSTTDLLAQRSALNRQRDGRLFQFPKLDAAQAELASIERRYRKRFPKGDAATLDASDATEAAFRGAAPQHPWLHLITHGYFAPAESSAAAMQSKAGPVEPGLLSGLAFAGANSPPAEGKDDGILTALEVSSLDLSHVDTVVLSACETGLGQVAGGEGLLGLQRSFQVAGAKTVVASLWKVPDAATSRLMQRFYENMWDKKMGKLAALREAQIWMIRDKGNRGLTLEQDQPAESGALPPFYWAAFVLSGDWR